jgi:hypothetical protein
MASVGASIATKGNCSAVHLTRRETKSRFILNYNSWGGGHPGKVQALAPGR